MTQSLKSDDAAHKEYLDALDIQTTAAEITLLVETEYLSHLEAASRWMEERSIPESLFAKYVPKSIVERIKIESVEDGLLRPSLAKINTHPSLDFMYG